MGLKCTLHKDQKQRKPSSRGKKSIFWERLLQETHCPVWQCGNQNCCLKAKKMLNTYIFPSGP